LVFSPRCPFFFPRVGALRAPPSFPTRRSSDLAGPAGQPAPTVDPFPGAPERSHAVLQPRREGTRTHAVQGAVAMSYVRWIGLIADRKSTRLNSSHVKISYAVFCLKKKTRQRLK